MTVRIDPRKPQVKLRSAATSYNPSRNYIFNVLYRYLQKVTPKRGFDAGAGEMRNRWMFPHDYVGVTQGYDTYFVGVERNKKILERMTGATTVYLTRLEKDFSFIAPVDIAVSTYTVEYIADKHDIATRLADRVQVGGSLFMQDRTEHAEATIAALEPHFEALDVIYYGVEGIDIPAETGNDEEVYRLTALEMSTPNKPDHHFNYCIIASGKKTPAGPTMPMPDLVDDRGLLILKRDLDLRDGVRFT